MDVMDRVEYLDKSTIRQLMTQKKRGLTDEQIVRASSQLTELFCSLDEFQSASCLFAYISFNQEVRTRKIIETALSLGKRVAVPKVAGKDLVFHYLTHLQDLDGFTKSSYGIPEPADQLKCADGQEREVLMLLPGLAFDLRGARVGYGKGYYDRYLSRFPEVHFRKIALCYPFQLMEHIETDAYDQLADRVITLPEQFM